MPTTLLIPQPIRPPRIILRPCKLHWAIGGGVDQSTGAQIPWYEKKFKELSSPARET